MLNAQCLIFDITVQYRPKRFKNTRKHPDDARGQSFCFRHQAGPVTYDVRRTCVQRTVYVRTAFGIRAYTERRTSPSG